MIGSPSLAYFGRRWWPWQTLTLVLAFAAVGDAATPKSAHRPRIYVDASLIEGLIAAPVPNYPAEAAKNGWAGLGVFELHFRPDGAVQNVVTVLTTGHQQLDDTARASLLNWRHKPGFRSSGRMTMSFSIHHGPVTLQPSSQEVVKNMPVRPSLTYPLEARRLGWTGTALFVMRFMPDGGIERVVALRSSGHAVLDEECIRTLQRWRCLPGVYTTAYIPVTFTLSR